MKREKMIIYADVILIENIIMNYIIIFATAIITKKEVKNLNFLLSSIIGGIYAIFNYVSYVKLEISVFLKIVLSIIMIYISFKPKKIKMLLKELLIFYLTSFTFGGASFMLLYFIEPKNIIHENGILIGTYPIKVAIGGGFLGFIILILSFKNIKSKLGKSNIFCNIEIYFENKRETIKVMIDSGNLLKDPISGIPVIVVEKESMKNIISSKLLNNIEDIILGENTDIEENYKNRLRIIPFSSLGKENGLLLGIKPEYIKLLEDDEEKIISNVIIGIYQKKLSKNNKYSGLISLDILEGGYEKNGDFANNKI